jgi:hypothetical protein
MILNIFRAIFTLKLLGRWHIDMISVSGNKHIQSRVSIVLKLGELARGSCNNLPHRKTHHCKRSWASFIHLTSSKPLSPITIIMLPSLLFPALPLRRFPGGSSTKILCAVLVFHILATYIYVCVCVCVLVKVKVELSLYFTNHHAMKTHSWPRH